MRTPLLTRPLATEMQAQDAGLVERVRRRDLAAVEELYDRHANMVYAIGLRILRDSTEAQDLVQDVFLHLWRRADQFDGEHGTFRGWLVSLARNRAIDRIRARKTPNKGTDAHVGEPPNAVGRALALLPDVQRTAIELAYFEGLSHGEIAERLETPLVTVKARIRIGMIRLRDQLGEFADVGPAPRPRKLRRRRSLLHATRIVGPRAFPKRRDDEPAATDSRAEGTALDFVRRTRPMSLEHFQIASSLLLAFLLAALLSTAASAQWARVSDVPPTHVFALPPSPNPAFGAATPAREFASPNSRSTAARSHARSSNPSEWTHSPSQELSQ